MEKVLSTRPNKYDLLKHVSTYLKVLKQSTVTPRIMYSSYYPISTTKSKLEEYGTKPSREATRYWIHLTYGR